ncbi:murein L,D-transpeptidase catalytic domain family protein [Flavobacterium agricola]|uniref:Murein L,D-transpeptidase catalytic domain family protein n=1 Tax=Flavobacterium agricola TaxID=2870839 RepID=A0ABY6LWH0_9FLAO|nr:murein L,D-transpeptidase catalytic domain family protein [Flavobacterium agricola]UYW00679.1 murein L,D-transpeptidase catalytic domain family protein [Flavobacterium agricola]
MKKPFPVFPLFLFVLLICFSFTSNYFSNAIDATFATSKKAEAIAKPQTFVADAPISIVDYASENAYDSIAFEPDNKPSLLCFNKAFTAYKKLVQKDAVANPILTIVDLSLSSNQKRMWVIDMEIFEVVMHLLVSHGMNSGDEFATKFSNKTNSFQSSLGAFLTGEIYEGKNGTSMRLDGLNPKLNGLARQRGIVVHGADYVSPNFIANNGRLGRSQGCPAVETEINLELIKKIQSQSVFFIYHNSLETLTAAQHLNTLNLQGLVKGYI